MPNLLFVKASPRRGRSHSAAAAEALLAPLASAGWRVDRLDLWGAPLPDLDGAALAAKYARLAGHELDGPERTAWASIAAMVERLDSADRVVIATPMWNFGIPYRLKHWIDLVTQPGLTFTFDPVAGYAPLLHDRPVTVVLASAGDYARGQSRGRPDLASGYLEAALAFVGFRSVEIVRVGPTIGDPAAVEAASGQARDRLAGIAREARA